jgi:hypothetical protein
MASLRRTEKLTAAELEQIGTEGAMRHALRSTDVGRGRAPGQDWRTVERRSAHVSEHRHLSCGGELSNLLNRGSRTAHVPRCGATGHSLGGEDASAECRVHGASKGLPHPACTVETHATPLAIH